METEINGREDTVSTAEVKVSFHPGLFSLRLAHFDLA